MASIELHAARDHSKCKAIATYAHDGHGIQKREIKFSIVAITVSGESKNIMRGNCERQEP